MKKLLKSGFVQKAFTAILLLTAAAHLSMGPAKTRPDEERGHRKTEVEKGSRKKAKSKPGHVNGFSLDEIVGTVNAIQANPAIAQFEFRVSNKWIKGGHNRSWIQGFYGGGQEDNSRKKPFVYDNSEPPILLGANEGANPVEYILHGLAGCMTTTMVLHAAANGINIDSVESKLEGDLDVQGFLGLNDQVRNGYQQIRVTFTVEGDLTQEEKMKLESFVQKSPVFDIVTNKVPVQVALQF
ncbi:OsmC family protein [Negadavirga shengliensis]|uniref:OsmC family protein n=1 Tax=Negadavirga shengliensis TaxID=1389218 RepID=A0ABV9T1F0_9BACT